MKKLQKGFIVPLVLGTIALLSIGLGSYVFINQQVKAPAVNEVVGTPATTTANDADLVTSKVNTNTVKPITATTVNCEDEKCFASKFASCEPAKLTADDGMGIAAVEYKIIDKGVDGCNMTFKYTKYPDPSWANKEMVCEFDNKLSFDSSIQKVFSGIPEGKVMCTGPLFNILRGSE